MLNHGMAFNLGCAKVCSFAIFETYFCYDKDIWIAVISGPWLSDVTPIQAQDSLEVALPQCRCQSTRPFGQDADFQSQQTYHSGGCIGTSLPRAVL